MDTDTYNSLNPSPPPQPARLMPLPSIQLHPSLSSAAARHPQTSTPTSTVAIGPSPSRTSTSIAEFGKQFEITTTITNKSSHSASYRTTSRASTASSVGSVDGNSDYDDEWDHHPTNRHRHHPYQSHQSHSSHPHHSTSYSRQRVPPLSISPSYSRRTSVYSAHSQYSQSHDDMMSFIRASASVNHIANGSHSASHSANASADEGGSNSNSYYDGEGDSPVATSLSTTSSPIFPFVPGGPGAGGHAHNSHYTSQGGIGVMPDGSSSASAGRPGVGTGAAGSGSGGGGHTTTSNTTHTTHTTSSTTPLSLDSLPSYPADQKPPFSYPVLIRLAILGSPQKRLLLSQIYSSIEDKFPWYRDSAPKAWKASVRHCLSLNKEFVRIQRAVEDPGVGCGGWWSVGEGMKGLKRPRKRRPAQSRRPEHELDPAPMIKTPTPTLSPLAIRRRHSTTFEDALTGLDPYSRYISPLSSSSLPPSAGGEEVLLPPIDDYSLRLPPLHIPHTNTNTNTNTAHLLPTPPSSSRTVVFGAAGGGEIKREYEYHPQRQGYGHPFHSSYEKPRGTHTPTASSSSSYSTQSYGSASSASSSTRPNPMSISSLLNERGSSTSHTVASTVTERLDRMDIDMDVDIDLEEPTPRPDHGASPSSGLPAPTPTPTPASTSTSSPASVQPRQEAERNVEMRPANNNAKANKAKVETPFSSDQTLRPPSPSSISPQSGGRRSSTPVAAAPTPKRLPSVPAPTEPPQVEERRREHRDCHREGERESAPKPHSGRDETRPLSRSRVHAERTAPARPTRPPPPVPGSSSSKGSSTTTREKERERKSTKSGRSVRTTAKSAGASKPWANSMDLSVMEPESESE